MLKDPCTLLVVKNLALSEQFYRDILGLTLVEKHADCLKLTAGNHEIILFQGEADAVAYGHGADANSTLVFTVDNLNERIKALKSHHVEFVHHTPNQNRWGRYAAFKDPSGIIHELFEYIR